MKRLITEKDGKVFNFSLDVLTLGVLGKRDYSQCRFKFRNPVPVYDDSHRMIGSALLGLEHNTIVGSFSIDYATPERLNIQTKDLPVFPCIEGFSITVKGKVEKYIHCFIDAIVLTMFPDV